MAPLYVRCHGCGRRRASHNIRYCSECGKILCRECYVPDLHLKGLCVSRAGAGLPAAAPMAAQVR
ncbi:MAG: hypothetical protein QW587_02590 [Candidatus Bathyarchaeia archaeon]